MGVSVLCPAYVPTGISDSERNRPPDLSNRGKSKTAFQLDKEAMLKKAVASGRLSAEDVARAVVAAGALMFVISDLLIFLRTGRPALDVLPVGLAVWGLYFGGQALIATGVVRALRRAA